MQHVTKHPSGLSSEEVALIAALIGALAATIPQLVIFLMTGAKEENDLKKEMIADERRIAYLLTEYYKELVIHKVHKQYWYRTSEIKPDKDGGSDSHNRHFISNQRSFETMTTIRVTTSEYFKKVTHFTILAGENKKTNKILWDIKSFQPRKASEFSEIKAYDELLKAEPIE